VGAALSARAWAGVRQVEVSEKELRELMTKAQRDSIQARPPARPPARPSARPNPLLHHNTRPLFALPARSPRTASRPQGYSLGGGVSSFATPAPPPPPAAPATPQIDGLKYTQIRPGDRRNFPQPVPPRSLRTPGARPPARAGRRVGAPASARPYGAGCPPPATTAARRRRR
jgi:hypothetical protein